MSPDSMGWWYWFGMWVFGVASIVITWWLLLDAFRRKGSAAKFTWPLLAVAGLLMQIPAFAVATDAQESSTGVIAGLIGIGGLILVSIAAITHFSRSSAGGSTWSLRTRDEGSSSRSSSVADRRHSRAPQASVPVGPAERSGAQRRVPEPATTRAPVPTPAPSANANASARPPASSVGSDGQTIHGEDQLEERNAVGAATVLDEPAPTVVDEPLGAPESVAATIAADAEPAPTIIDDAITIAEDAALDSDGEAPRLTITDGKSSQVIITERSGPFVVGRDPSRCTLAVDDARASRAHFSITHHDGQYFVQDLGSSNGTFVNGALIPEQRALADGDTIEFGRTVATFRMPS